MKNIRSLIRSRHSATFSYSLAVATMALAIVLSAWLNTPPLFIAAIVICAWFGGFRAGLLAILLSTIGICSKSEVTGFNGVIFIGGFLVATVVIVWVSSAHHDLHEALTLFRSLLDNANDAIEVVDPESGRFLDVNQRACSLHNLSRDEYLKLYVQEMNPEAAARPWQDFVTHLRAVGSLVLQSQHRRKDGTLFPVEINVTYVKLKRDYLIAVVRDITERKRAEEKVEQAQQNLRLVIDTIPTMAWTVNAGGAVDFVNKRWLDYTGITSEEEFANPGMVIHPDDRTAAMERWAASVAKGIPYQYKMRLRRFDGTYRWFLVQTAPLRDTQNNIIRWYGTSTDITDQITTEEELRKSQSELARVIRASTVGELTASIAHEVNQPLAAVVANANACLNWMAATPPNFDEAREALQRIVRDGKRASDVISRIRTLLSKAEPDRSPCHLSDIIKEIVALTEIEVRKRNVNLQTSVAPDLPTLTADHVQLQQVLLNLIMNALDALNEITGRPRLVTINASIRESGDVCVSVEDNGAGIEADRRERLFEAFYTNKAMGLGMGLSICRSIVEAHGGKIWADSIATQGSRFTFTLPATMPEKS